MNCCQLNKMSLCLWLTPLPHFNAMQDSSEKSLRTCSASSYSNWPMLERDVHMPASYLSLVAVIVQVGFAQQTWQHLQGSLESLTPFVQGLSHAVAPLHFNTFLIFQRNLISPSFSIGIILIVFSYLQNNQHYRWTRGMTTPNKGNKALKVNSLHDTKVTLCQCE